MSARHSSSKGSAARGEASDRKEAAELAASAREGAWLELMPSRHFVMAEDRERRCAMCNKAITAGERYFGSRTVDYAAVVRFHSGCAEEYLRNMPRS